MESGTARRTPPLPGLVQTGSLVVLVVIAGASWAPREDRMGGMDAGPGTVVSSFYASQGLLHGDGCAVAVPPYPQHRGWL